jgi:hypothetical protein
MNEWYKNPTILIVGAVALVGGYVLLKNQGASSTPSSTGSTASNPSTNTTPVGGSYSYLDGSGVEHIIATDPNGNLNTYANVPPGDSSSLWGGYGGSNVATYGAAQSGQLGSYVGMMGGMFNPSWMGYSPYYAGTPAPATN